MFPRYSPGTLFDVSAILTCSSYDILGQIIVLVHYVLWSSSEIVARWTQRAVVAANDLSRCLGEIRHTKVSLVSVAVRLHFIVLGRRHNFVWRSGLD